MITTVLIVIVGLVVLFLVIAALQPAEFRVVRSIEIVAPAAKVFELINNFHQWDSWSPWAKLDPTMTQTFEGPESGKGAVYNWDGKGKVGAGRMTILENRPYAFIGIQLEFLKPFAATNTAEFEFQTEGTKTEVVWSMYGKKNFPSKAFGLVMNMDKLIGGDFEKGLSQMKAVAENQVIA